MIEGRETEIASMILEENRVLGIRIDLWCDQSSRGVDFTGDLLDERRVSVIHLRENLEKAVKFRSSIHT